jgi:hypothetical protein
MPRDGERRRRRCVLTGERKVLTNCHRALTDRGQVAHGFRWSVHLQGGGLPCGAGIALPGGAGLGIADRASGLALRHRVAIGASQGRPPPERLPSSRSGRRVQGSALAAGGNQH